MAIEELTEGAVLTEDQVTEYGFVKSDLGVAGACLYEKGRKKLLLEATSEGHKIGLVYELPEI